MATGAVASSSEAGLGVPNVARAYQRPPVDHGNYDEYDEEDYSYDSVSYDSEEDMSDDWDPDRERLLRHMRQQQSTLGSVLSGAGSSPGSPAEQRQKSVAERRKEWRASKGLTRQPTVQEKIAEIRAQRASRIATIQASQTEQAQHQQQTCQQQTHQHTPHHTPPPQRPLPVHVPDLSPPLDVERELTDGAATTETEHSTGSAREGFSAIGGALGKATAPAATSARTTSARKKKWFWWG